MDYEMIQEMDDKAGCTAVGSQDVDVCVPVTVKPFGKAGNAKTKCMGTAVVYSGSDHCKGQKDGVCKFTITQKLRIEVPVVFGANVEIGDASVECGKAHDEMADGFCSCECAEIEEVSE